MACQKNNCTGMEVGLRELAEEGLGARWGEGGGDVRAAEEGGAISREHDGK